MSSVCPWSSQEKVVVGSWKTEQGRVSGECWRTEREIEASWKMGGAVGVGVCVCV